MPLSNRARGRSDRPATVKFAHVTGNERRPPSWLARPNLDRRHPSVHPTSPRGPGDSPFTSTRGEIERGRPPTDGSAGRTSQRAPGASSFPPNRSGVNPSELEALVADRALQTATAHILEEGRAALSEAIEALDQSRRDIAYGSEPRLVELAMLVARRVIGRELVTQPDIVADLVREGVDALAASDSLRVRIGPGFQSVQDAILEHLSSRGIVVDLAVAPSLSEYGCVVQTDLGRVDESIDERLAVLLDSIDEEGHA
jgi:hypothetical protein